VILFLNPLGAKKIATWIDVIQTMEGKRIRNERKEERGNEKVTKEHNDTNTTIVNQECHAEDNIENTNTSSSSSPPPSPPNCIFIDIGGNRALHSVVQMITWVQNEFSPRIIVVKSEELVEEIVGKDNGEEERYLKKKMKRMKVKAKNKDTVLDQFQQEAKKRKVNDESIHRCTKEQQQQHDHCKTETCKKTMKNVHVLKNGQIQKGNEWFKKLVHQCMEEHDNTNHDSSTTTKTDEHSTSINTQQQQPYYIHPLKAPITYSPTDASKPICRYHNYHKDGCKRYKTDESCPLDHTFCHWCLQPGHIALDCVNR